MNETTGMETLGTVFTQFTTWMGNIVTTISSNALLLLPIGIFCVGAAIGLAQRLIGRQQFK